MAFVASLKSVVQPVSDEILTLPEVAGRLKVAEKTVNTMAQRAELPPFRVRGQWRFERVDLDHWIEAQKNIHTQPADAELLDAILKSHGRQNDH